MVVTQQMLAYNNSNKFPHHYPNSFRIAHPLRFNPVNHGAYIPEIIGISFKPKNYNLKKIHFFL